MRLAPALRSATILLGILVATPARAHIQLMSPTARHTEQKTGPCGILNDVRGDKITTYAPGETITVVWEETVNHPGHFRIAFDADGFDDFVEPASYDDFYTGSAVLVDDIADQQGGIYMQEVTLPDITCDNCTLQVIQVMTDKQPYGDGNDLYYQCADLVLGDPVDTSGTESDGTSSTSDGTTTSGTSTSAGTTGETTGETTATSGGSSSGSATGSSSSGIDSSGSTAGSGDSEASASATSEGASGGADPEDSGCSCTEGAGGGSAGLVGLLAVAAVRRRRRCG